MRSFSPGLFSPFDLDSPSSAAFQRMEGEAEKIFIPSPFLSILISYYAAREFNKFLSSPPPGIFHSLSAPFIFVGFSL